MKWMPQQKHIRRSKGEQGAVLPMVIAFLAVFTVMSLTSLQNSVRQSQLSRVRTNSFQSIQLAKGAVNRIAREFQNPVTNLIAQLLCKPAYNPVEDPNCDRAQNLCFQGKDLFPKSGTTNLPHGGMMRDGLRAFDSTNSTDLPKLWGDFRIRIHDPILARDSAPNSGNALEQTCTYRVSVTVTGLITDPHEQPNRRELASRAFRAYVNVTAHANYCSGCPNK